MNQLPTGDISEFRLYREDELTPKCASAIRIARLALEGARAETQKLARRIRGQREFMRRLREETKEIQERAQAKAESEQRKADAANRRIRDMQAEYARMDSEYRTAKTRLQFVDEDRARLTRELEERRKDHISEYEAMMLRAQVQAANAARTRLTDLFERERSGYTKQISEANGRARLAEERARQLSEKIRSIRFTYDIGEPTYSGYETWLYYCGCTHRGKTHPEVCPYHYSPRTQEGMIDGH